MDKNVCIYIYIGIVCLVCGEKKKSEKIKKEKNYQQKKQTNKIEKKKEKKEEKKKRKKKRWIKLDCSPVVGVQGEGVLSWSADRITDQKAPVSSTLLKDALCLRPRHILVVPAGEKEDASS